MYITFEELRKIKHSLPHGSVKKIADELEVDEQTVRNYFGANKVNDEGDLVEKHVQPGPQGGYVELTDTRILDLAKEILAASEDHSEN
ncbi:MAG: DNA-binding protein [Saprospiraceae bacterium]|jgi:predicted transcriptional regulator|nr:DNA-binding protein [Saprospiraceae bacterium]